MLELTHVSQEDPMQQLKSTPINTDANRLCSARHSDWTPSSVYCNVQGVFVNTVAYIFYYI